MSQYIRYPVGDGLDALIATSPLSYDSGTNTLSISGVVLANGTVPLTANWNVGGFALSGLTGLSANVDSASDMASSLSGRFNKAYFGRQLIVGDVGTSSIAAVVQQPTGKMTYVGANAGQAQLFLESYGNVSDIQIRAFNGTNTTPTGTLSGNTVGGNIRFVGYDGVSSAFGGGLITATASENWSGSARGTNLFLLHTLSGTSARQITLQVGADKNISWTNMRSHKLFNVETDPPFYATQSFNGTISAPTAILSGNDLGGYVVGGYNGTAYVQTGGMFAIATENFASPNSHGTQLDFYVHPNSTAGTAIALSLHENSDAYLSRQLLMDSSVDGDANILWSLDSFGVIGMWNGTTSNFRPYEVNVAQHVSVGGAGGTGHLILLHSNGGLGTETATLSGDFLGVVHFEGFTGTGYGESGQVYGEATENWGVGSQGSRLILASTPNTTATKVDALALEQNGDASFLVGNVIISTAGKGLEIKEGSNARMGVATLVAGTVTVSTTQVTANSRIFLSQQNISGVSIATAVAVTNRVASTSFDIVSANVLDISDIAWMIVEPA